MSFGMEIEDDDDDDGISTTMSSSSTAYIDGKTFLFMCGCVPPFSLEQKRDEDFYGFLGDKHWRKNNNRTTRLVQLPPRNRKLNSEDDVIKRNYPPPQTQHNRSICHRKHPQTTAANQEEQENDTKLYLTIHRERASGDLKRGAELITAD